MHLRQDLFQHQAAEPFWIKWYITASGCCFTIIWHPQWKTTSTSNTQQHNGSGQSHTKPKFGAILSITNSCFPQTIIYCFALLSSPYSKFYSYLDVDSPGRIGQWIGYQMLKKYQKRTGESLQEIIAASPQEILKKSKYNP